MPGSARCLSKSNQQHSSSSDVFRPWTVSCKKTPVHLGSISLSLRRTQGDQFSVSHQLLGSSKDYRPFWSHSVKSGHTLLHAHSWLRAACDRLNADRDLFVSRQWPRTSAPVGTRRAIINISKCSGSEITPAFWKAITMLEKISSLPFFNDVMMIRNWS